MGDLTRRTAMGGLVAAALAGCGSGTRATSSRSPSSSPSPTTSTPAELANQRLLSSGLTTRTGPTPGAAGTSMAVNPEAVVVGTAPDSTIQQIARLATSYQPTILEITGATAPTQSLLILAPATKATYDQWTGEKDNPAESGATVFPSPPAQPWVALKPETDQRRLEVTLAHEMLHALTLTFASNRDQPTWLTEGFAQLVSADVTQIVELAATPPEAASLPTDAQFRAQPERSYVLAFLFATFLQQKRRDAVAAFYTPAVHGQSGDLDRLAHSVFGATIPELTQQWQAHYAAQVKTLRG